MRIIEVNPDLYEIPLPKGAVYQKLKWETDLPTAKCSYTVVEAPIAKFISLCKDPYQVMIPPASEWGESMRNEYIKGQDPSKRFGMPRIGFCERKNPRSLGDILTFQPKTVWAVGFTNGRHRVRIAEYLGAEYIPVQVPNSQVSDLRKYLQL